MQSPDWTLRFILLAALLVIVSIGLYFKLH